MQDATYIAPADLAIGMFVILELSWLEHPFVFSSFVIQTEEQLKTLRSLKLKSVKIDPLRSKALVRCPDETLNDARSNVQAAGPKPGEADDAAEADGPVETGAAEPSPAMAAKLVRIEQNRVLRSSMHQAEKKAAKAAQILRQSTRQFGSNPAQAIAGASNLVREIAESLCGSSEVMIHLLNDKVAGEEIYFHSFNVAMLALILGKAMALDADTLRTIGMAAIFHDLGKEEIPSRILLKTDPLTHAEEAMLKRHPEIGAQNALRAGMAPAVVAAILLHHENLDGSGYPHGVGGDKIGVTTRVIAIANHYDNLCNPPNLALAKTPYEALSLMFSKHKNWFDAAMLGKMVHSLGVYPPGSIVRLSSGATGMVISVNHSHPLQPTVMVYDASVPKAEAIILDLEQTPEISISKAMRPGMLTPSVYEYLSPRKRVTYYFDGGNSPA